MIVVDHGIPEAWNARAERVTRWTQACGPALMLLLLGGCQDPASPPTERLNAVVEGRMNVTVPGRMPTDKEEAEALAAGRIRPVGAFPQDATGCYRCSVTSIFFYPGAEEPTEREREDATLHLGGNWHAPSSIVATIEGCPFFVTRATQPNPEAHALGPNTCGETRYHDGFLLIRPEVMRGEYAFRHLPSGESVDCEPIGEGECETWERTEWWVTAQLSGRFIRGSNRNAHAIHTYLCLGVTCLR